MVPNQRMICVHREKCVKDFLQIKKENWYAANADLTPYGLQLYLYLIGNKDGYEFELSQEAALLEAGIKKTTFHKYVNEMIEKGYLVPKRPGSNIYDLYERPVKLQITEPCSESEQVQTLCEQLCSQDNRKVSSGSKEIDNKEITEDSSIYNRCLRNGEFYF
jgi:hypothetical protein